MNGKILEIASYLHTKYIYNTNHINNFIATMGKNINKLTTTNADDLFNMYVIVLTKKFNGFTRWGPGNNKTPELNLSNHYKKHITKSNENWQKYMNGSISCNQYGEYAINTSRFMKKKIIHTNGTKVYLSGFGGFDGKVLIIGRLDNNRLGISSCYVVSDSNYTKKINNFKNNACFENI
jgi:hypothetical protein